MELQNESLKEGFQWEARSLAQVSKAASQTHKKRKVVVGNGGRAGGKCQNTTLRGK